MAVWRVPQRVTSPVPVSKGRAIRDVWRPLQRGVHEALPEQRLICAVLETAVNDLRAGYGEGAASARMWVNSHLDTPFSLTWCCEALDLDSEIVRNELRGIIG